MTTQTSQGSTGGEVELTSTAKSRPIRRSGFGGRSHAHGLFGSTTSAITVVLVAVCIIIAILSPRFLTLQNVYAILAQSAVVGICAVGGTFVIITAGIDLSVGAGLGLAGMVGALFMGNGSNAFVGIIITFAVALIIGVVNGIASSWLHLAPFIVTLATMGMAEGLTLQVSQGQSVYKLPAGYTVLGGASLPGGLPVSLIFTVIMFVIGHLVLTRTSFGKSVYAVGGNKEAARLAGIRVERATFFVYLIAAFCMAVAGIVLVGRVGAATPTAGPGTELQVIAAVVIGGTSLFGGKGSLIGTAVGVLLISVVDNGLTLLNVNPFLVQFVQSALILVAVLFDAVNNRRLARRLQRASEA